HKTGTTFWQKNIFATSDVNLIDRAEVRANILAFSPYSFSAKKLNDWLEPLLDIEKLNVISEEELSGNTHTSGNGRSITYETIERLSQITVAEVSILIFIRNQQNIIDSCYRQYIKRGGSFSFKNYIYSENKGAERHRFPGFSFEHFKYDDVIEHCIKKFDKKRIIVKAYEDFVISKQDIVADVSEELGEQLIINQGSSNKLVNQSLSNFTITLSRITNRLFNQDPISRNSILGLNFLQPILHRLYLLMDKALPSKLINKPYISKELQLEINQYYASSNSRTEKITGLDLTRLNYPKLEQSKRS
ncbi:MAG: hypothetical protein HQ521_18895, partial [Bacteroidetes bacterium]|nr:hypothetical protein [Bacteroidota bacterium]